MAMPTVMPMAAVAAVVAAVAVAVAAADRVAAAGETERQRGGADAALGRDGGGPLRGSGVRLRGFAHCGVRLRGAGGAWGKCNPNQNRKSKSFSHTFAQT